MNLSINNEAFVQNFKEIKAQFDVKENKNQTVMVEYSSPNTNKPLHLGHIRNNLLGFSVAQILKEAGYNVVKLKSSMIEESIFANQCSLGKNSETGNSRNYGFKRR